MGAFAPDEEFEAAYRELFPRAATLAWRLLGNRTAAEDVAAEALARTYAHWHKVRNLPHRDGWVLRVATNLAIDTARKRPVVVERPSIEPLDAAEAATLRLALLGALRTLPKQQRHAIALRYLTGLPEGEVADVLGVSAGTASTHLRRGLDALRRRLGKDFREDVFIGELQQT